MSNQSFFLTKEVVLKAVTIATAAFQEAYTQGASKGTGIYVVVMDPVKIPEDGFSFDQAILYEGAIGNPDAECCNLARSKAEVSWRYRMYSQEVQQKYPHLYVEGMTVWGGGVYLHQMAAAASGVQYQMDQWFAELIIITCRALCIGLMRELLKTEQSYVGGKPD